MRTVAIVVAAGSGVRMGLDMPKALMPVGGRPMVAWSLDALADTDEVDGIVLVGPPGWEEDTSHAIGALVDLLAVVPGGATRQRSVARGLAVVPDEVEVVLVHDAARPLVTPELAGAVVEAVEGVDGAIAAAPLADTLKRADEDLIVAATIDRAALWRAETPQAFHASVLRRAFELADDETLDLATDCASMVEALGGRVRLVPAIAPNLKVTTPPDIALAEYLLRASGVLVDE
jgi:2-C-methyl-D-erythritol 4-phosphate cytidylyltransferase